jgi:hypothetical protein
MLVIASNASCLPEVVGEAGILVEPRDVRGLVEVMEGVLFAGEEGTRSDFVPAPRHVERGGILSPRDQSLGRVLPRLS